MRGKHSKSWKGSFEILLALKQIENWLNDSKKSNLKLPNENFSVIPHFNPNKFSLRKKNWSLHLITIQYSWKLKPKELQTLAIEFCFSSWIGKGWKYHKIISFANKEFVEMEKKLKEIKEEIYLITLWTRYDCLRVKKWNVQWFFNTFALYSCLEKWFLR